MQLIVMPSPYRTSLPRCAALKFVCFWGRKTLYRKSNRRDCAAQPVLDSAIEHPFSVFGVLDFGEKAVYASYTRLTAVRPVSEYEVDAVS
jgi:hypothetical protein